MDNQTGAQKRRTLLKAFFKSQFKYCPLISMFHSCQLNKIKRLHLRALRFIYDDYNETFEKALQRDRSCTIY